MNGILITMRKNTKEIKFFLFDDCSYRILTRSGWSDICEDFADKYIKLRDSGFEEVPTI